MKTITINLGLCQQRLSEILPNKCIPSNVILNKTITNVGATYSELKADRNSIIIEPNSPVITVKRKMPNILGVKKGVTTQDVIGYLSNYSIKYKKILVTPESYHKVQKAARAIGIDLYEEFFLLFDECDRTSKDIDFRETIVLPMFDFFQYKQKAFVSATAVTPKDPRFQKQKFSLLQIAPEYDYSKQLRLIHTNNVFDSTRRLLKQENEESDETVFCIFFNSTDGIVSIIKHLGLEQSDYTIFCSRDKKYEFQSNGYRQVKDEVDGKYSKYNFFTSRFYSAVDMYMKNRSGTPVKPVVIMLTHLFIAQHTMIDPSSDAIQIPGRFRDGVEKVIAITNINNAIAYKGAKQAESFLDGAKHGYDTIRSLWQATPYEGAKQVLEEALKSVFFAKFVDEDGRPNCFMYDNYFHKEHLKSLYTDIERLKKAYNIPHYRVSFDTEVYTVDDTKLDYLRGKSLYKNLVIQICDLLDQIKKRKTDDKFVIDNTDECLTELNNDFPEICRGYKMLGKEITIENGSSKAAIVRAVDAIYYEQQKGNFDFIRRLNLSFPIGTTGPLDKFKEKIQLHIDALNLTHLRPSKTLLGNYLDIVRTTERGTGKKVYSIRGHKFSNA